MRGTIVVEMEQKGVFVHSCTVHNVLKLSENLRDKRYPFRNLKEVRFFYITIVRINILCLPMIATFTFGC